MRNTICLGLLLLAAFAGAQVKWYLSYDFARKVSERTGKPILLELHIGNSPVSNRHIAITYADEAVKEACASFLPVRLDAQLEGADLARKLNVQRFSAILVIDAKGNVRSRSMGYMTPSMMRYELTRAKEALAYWQGPPVPESSQNVDQLLLAAMSHALSQTGKDRALRYLARAETLDPTRRHKRFWDVYVALGDHEQFDQQMDPAIAYFRRAISLANDNQRQFFTRINIATSWINSNRGNRGLDDLKVAQAIPGLAQPESEYVQRLLRLAGG